jgi:hypothetical protein
MAPIFTGSKFGFGRSAADAPVPISATGGNQTPSSGLAPGNGYKYHTFTSPGTFTVSGGPGTVEVLVVGGGGAGGGRAGGGGGAGGIAYAINHAITAPSVIPIVVGPGGPAPTPAVNSGDTGPSGGDSTFGDVPNPYYIIAKGGGGGGGDGSNGAATTGGSGGGQMYGPPSWGANIAPATQPSQNPGKPNITNYGNSGGSGVGNPYFNSGGGGGAGANGTNGTVPAAGPGGNGVQFPAFTGPLIGVPALNPLSGYFGGGGGGGQHPSVEPIGTGGLGGGGNSGSGPGVPGSPGTANSGGGGGGAFTHGEGSQVFSGGSGGSGIVVIRYLV